MFPAERLDVAHVLKTEGFREKALILGRLFHMLLYQMSL
jgi:hypothetical protein